VLGVIGDSVALVINAPHHPRIGARHLPDHEEGGLHTFRCEGLENGVGVTRQRTIVERQHDLMIVKRQRFGVLYGAYTGMLSGVDHECAADPERARWACSASAVPISKTRMAHAAMALRMIPFCREIACWAALAWTACTAIMASRASERKDNTPQYARRLLRCMIAGFSRCTRLPRKEKPWLVESVLLSRPLLWAFRALLPMPQQLACSKLR